MAMDWRSWSPQSQRVDHEGEMWCWKRNGDPPTITNDGVTIAKEIDLEDPFENMGAQMVKEVALRLWHDTLEKEAIHLALNRLGLSEDFEKTRLDPEARKAIEVKAGGKKQSLSLIILFQLKILLVSMKVKV
jgi:hypothetical protein